MSAIEKLIQIIEQLEEEIKVIKEQINPDRSACVAVKALLLMLSQFQV